MPATFVHEGRSIDHTPSLAVEAGDVVIRGNLTLIFSRGIPADTLGAGEAGGVWDLDKAAGSAGDEFDDGDDIDWDAGTETVVALGSGDIYLGKVLGDTDADAETVRVLHIQPPPPAGS